MRLAGHINSVRKPRKRSVNLSLDAKLVARARRHTPNLSAAVELLLRDFVDARDSSREAELENYRQAARWANEVLEQCGSLSDEFSTL